MADNESISSKKRELARELLDDIELSKIPLENIIMKSMRLARYVDNSDISKWLGWEMHGYDQDGANSKYSKWTGRLINEEKMTGYWDPLSSISSQIEINKSHLAQLRIPDITYSPTSANPNELVGAWASGNIPKITAPATESLNRMQLLSDQNVTLLKIKSKVLGLLHFFVRDIYFQLTFSGIQEGIFNHAKSQIDSLLAKSCGEILEKIPNIYSRLAEGDREAISQALNTCRRMIDSFADQVFPACDGKQVIDGKELELKKNQSKNRIEAFVRNYSRSVSRRERLRKRLDKLYDSVSSGVHDEVSAGEARFLFLDTYLLLGEIISLK